jgi:hypothetical protein
MLTFHNPYISFKSIEIFIENKIEAIRFGNQSIWTNFLSKYYDDEIVEDFLIKYKII